MCPLALLVAPPAGNFAPPPSAVEFWGLKFKHRHVVNDNTIQSKFLLPQSSHHVALLGPDYIWETVKLH
jgi:hypothetical protein